MSFSPSGAANSAPRNPLAGLRGHFAAGEREGKMEERKGTEGIGEILPFRNKYLVKLCSLGFTVWYAGFLSALNAALMKIYDTYCTTIHYR